MSLFALGWFGGNLLAHALFLALPLPGALLVLLLLGLLGRGSRLFWGVLFGFGWTTLWLSDHFHPLRQAQEVRALTGEIVEPVRETRYGWQVILESEEGRRFRLDWPKRYPEPHAGQVWQVHAKLFPPHGPFNPGGFDRERYDWLRGLDGWGRLRGPPELLAENLNLAALRESLSETLKERLQDASTEGVVQALLLGIRSNLSRRQREIFQATGTIHLLAISGLHIALIAGLFLRLLRRWSRLALLAAWGAACGYAVLAGFSLPTQRALVMVSVALLALWRRRWLPPWRAMSLALVAVLLLDPRAPLGLSFWLSFGAVFWIFYALTNRSGPPPWGRMALKIQGFLFLGLSPVLLATFGYISLTAPIANLMAIPVVGFLVVPLLFLGLFLLPFEGLSGMPLQLAAFLLKGLLWILQSLAWAVERPFPAPPMWAVVSALFGSLLLLMPRGLPGRWLGLFFWLPFFAASQLTPLEEGEVRLVLLDVGRGLAAVVETQNHLLLYDTGPPGKGRWIILPFLRWLGKNPDLIIVSHEGRDHSGGLQFLKSRFPEVPILSGTPEKLSGTIAPCFQSQRWRWDGVVFETLWPPDRSPGAEGRLKKSAMESESLSDHDRSCVLKVTAGDRVLLLVGEVSQRLARELPSELLKSDVVVISYHGSRDASSGRFLEAVQPRHVLFSSGHGRRSPAPEALERCRKIGATIHTTAQTGAIVVEGRSSGLAIRHWREVAGHYWNVPSGPPWREVRALPWRPFEEP